MATPQKASYGTWKSPVTADGLTQAAIGLGNVFIDSVTNKVYYIERRPSEGGRCVIVAAEDQSDVVGPEWNVRTRVHEYGGMPATARDGIIYFSNFKDGRVYAIVNRRDPEPVTPQNPNWRFAELTVLRERPSVLLAVLEDHNKPEPSNVVNKLVFIDTISKTVAPIVEGADFYASPVVSPNGKKLAWIQWHHPDMPWEGSELVLADITISETSIKVENAKTISGKRNDVSVGQPKWASDQILLFLSDASGYSNPCSFSLDSGIVAPISAKAISEDFCFPPWVLGMTDYAILDSNSVFYASTRDGRSILYLADLRARSLKQLPNPYAVITQLQPLSPHEAVFIGQTEDESDAIIKINIGNAGPTYTAIKSASSTSLPKEFISKAQSYALPLPPHNDPVHVLYYPPFNPNFVPILGDLPPAVVNVHGGPTSHSRPGLDWGKQFWTTRGWAWIEVNYGGSSGYGRKYRDRLRGNWGIIDVEDCAAAAKILGERGLIDLKRTAIRGGSSGGYTVLATLANKPTVFAAGTSLYGISDLFRLAEDTHKFESQYLFKLVGGTPQEIPEIYRDRSPLTHADKIVSPLLILQGADDKVVLPSQSEAIVKSIKERGSRYQYILFEGEGHGWRKAETIKKAWEAELAWYENVFGLRGKISAEL